MSPVSPPHFSADNFGRSVDGGGISLTILLTSAKWSLDGMLKAEIFFLIHGKRLFYGAKSRRRMLDEMNFFVV